MSVCCTWQTINWIEKFKLVEPILLKQRIEKLKIMLSRINTNCVEKQKYVMW